MYKYSIIIPVYNAQEFLVDCVNSIFAQSYTNYEIVLVDDGSTDNSPALCDKIAAEHPDKVVVIHTENGGTSSARNKGLKAATGDYIGFMDNDDHWRFDYGLERINECLQQSHADMLVYNSAQYFENEGKTVEDNTGFTRESISGMSCDEAIKKMLQANFLHYAVWLRFVKRSIITENEIYFPQNMRNEDTDWSARVLRYIKTVDACEIALYSYRKGNPYSQTSKPVLRSHTDDLKKILIENIDYAAALESKERKESIFAFLSKAYVVWLSQIPFFEDINADVAEMKKRFYILKFAQTAYLKAVYAFGRIFGLKLTQKILNGMLVRKYPFLKKSNVK